MPIVSDLYRILVFIIDGVEEFKNNKRIFSENELFTLLH